MNQYKYFEFTQTNSGGFYISDDNVAISVIIEAEDFDKAIDKALDIGIYFNGVENEYDCSCCGDRWNKYPEEIELPRKIYFFLRRSELVEKIANIATAYAIPFEFNQPTEGEFNIACEVSTIFEYMTLRPYNIYVGYYDANTKCIVHYVDGRKETFYAHS